MAEVVVDDKFFCCCFYSLLHVVLSLFCGSWFTHLHLFPPLFLRPLIGINNALWREWTTKWIVLPALALTQRESGRKNNKKYNNVNKRTLKTTKEGHTKQHKQQRKLPQNETSAMVTFIPITPRPASVNCRFKKKKTQKSKPFNCHSTW